MSVPSPQSQVRLGAFHAACWTLVLVAFVELVAVGVALALRHQSNSEPRIVERVVTEYVPLTVAPARPEASPDEPQPETTAESEAAPKPFLTAEDILNLPSVPVAHQHELEAPFIADPVVERLAAEAREARVADDIRAAITKLEEAETLAPEDPTVLYQSAELFEEMGIYEKAGDYYAKVWAMGPGKAGSLHKLAGIKISHGFEHSRRMEGKLRLGRIGLFNDKRVETGQRVILTVPILAAPDQTIDPKLLDVDISFFDKVNGEIQQDPPGNTVEWKWLTEPVDWKDTGEELLQFTYTIPPADQRDLHLLGERKHHGQIVELRYGDNGDNGDNGELLDHVAYPRTLARARNLPESDPLLIPDDFPIEDWNPGNPLLPPLPK